jgi:thioesterase domain-containing protein
MAQQLHSQGQHVAFLGMFDTYWGDLKARSLFDRAYYFYRKFEFPLRNLSFVPFKEIPRYILYKSRLAMKALFGSSKFDLTYINQPAYYRYTPETYQGRITLFRANKIVPLNNSCRIRWEDLAADGVDIRDIPVYPGSMIEEPFVKSLAKELRACIDEVTVSI